MSPFWFWAGRGARAIRQAGDPPGLETGVPRLVGDLARQLDSGLGRARKDPFQAGADYRVFDANSHSFGLAATAQLYRRVTGDDRYDAFGTEQRNWVLGANAWGASFMIGEGTTFPLCTASNLANLADSLNGRPPLPTGAVVNGPNSASLFSGGLGGYLPQMRHCLASSDPYIQFTGHGARFADDVRAWQTDEPAIDMDATHSWPSPWTGWLRR